MARSKRGEREVPGEGYSAFISHASTDGEAAETIVAELEAKGLRCWVAPRDLCPGAEYGEEILRGIARSKCFVLLLSEAANLSLHVRREVERAASKGKPIYPVRIEEIPPSPKLEYFISMHHWLDAWDGALAGYGPRLAAAIESLEEWTGNKIVRRRRWRLGGAATLIAAAAIAAAVVFGSDIRRVTMSPAERALDDLQEMGASFDADGLAQAVRSGDGARLALFDAAGIDDGAIASAFSSAEIARGFFENSKPNPLALEWFRGVAGRAFDSNQTVEHDYYERIGLLGIALGAGNVEAALALLDAGASPHIYENLWFTWRRFPAMLFPYTWVENLAGLSAEEKEAVMRKFAATGAVVAPPPGEGTYQRNLGQVEAMRKEQAILEERYGIDGAVVDSICEAPETPICRAASERTGFDWCAFARALPKVIVTESDYYEYNRIELVQLVNVIDDSAIVLAKLFDGHFPGYGLVRVSKDTRLWKAYKYTSPGAGMGLCKADANGNVRDNCWRRAEFVRSEDGRSLTMFDYYASEPVYCPVSAASAGTPE